MQVGVGCFAAQICLFCGPPACQPTTLCPCLTPLLPPPPLLPSRPCSAKGHLLNAGICQLCSADVATIRAALDRYRDIDLNFDNSREANFLAVSLRAHPPPSHPRLKAALLCRPRASLLA